MKNPALLLPVILALAACGPAPSDQSTPVTDTQASQSAGAAASGNRYLHATPSTLDNCSKGQAIGISWDLGTDFPGVTGVEIVVGPDDQPKLFSAGGAKGETTTGPWTKPGTIFRLMNKKTREEIERLTIGGPNC